MHTIKLAPILVIALSLAAFAQPSRPVIKTATIDYGNHTVTIAGQNFGATPGVTLAGITLTVENFNPATQTIVADLPGVLSAGTYNLTVSAGNGANNSTTID